MLLTFRRYKLDNVVLSQTKGIPIGGPMSGILLDVPLSCSEEFFDRETWPHLAKKFGLTGSRSDFILASRYADNTVAVSPWFCTACLSSIFRNVYQAFSEFDEDTDSHFIGTSIALKFLDAYYIFDWSHSNVQAIPVMHNELSIWRGKPSLRKKTRAPLVLGSTTPITSSLR